MPTQNIFDLVDTWASGGGPYTSIKMNATDNDSGSASLLMDLQVGTVSKFRVSKAGGVDCAWSGNAYLRLDGEDFQHFNASGIRDMLIGGNGLGVSLPSNYFVTWGTTSSTPLTRDLYLRRRGAANLALGAADAAAPVAQTLSVQSVVAGTTNTAGANLTITGSQGTGTGAGGSIIFQVAPAGSTGTAQNALSTALTINGSSRNVNVTTALTFTDTNYGTPPGIPAGFCGGNDSFDTFWQGNNLVLMGLRYDTGLTIGSGLYFGFSNTTGRLINSSGATDVRLYRDAANTLALRNDTAGQEFRVYDTYTSGSNYRRLTLGNGGGAGVIVSVNGAGAGNTGSLYLRANTSGGTLEFGTASTDRWRMDASGHFLAIADNLYDIGASGATRPRNVFIGGSIVVGDGGRISRQSAFGGILFNSNNSVEFASGATPVIFNGAQDFVEMTAPAAPAANSVRIYAVDNGSGKTQLMARFATGAAQQIAIEP